MAAWLAAKDPEYRAGAAAFGAVKALVLEDRRGNRMAFAEAEFTVTRALSDFAAVQLLKDYDLPREALVIRGVAARAGKPADVTTAVAAALGKLEPAVVRFGAGVLSVTDSGGRCLASISQDASLHFDGCAAAEQVRSPIRSVFQSIEPEHGLQQRGESPPAYPVQAIALGRQLVILALGGAVPPDRFHAPHRIIVSFANDSSPMPEDAQIRKAIRDALTRVER